MLHWCLKGNILNYWVIEWNDNYIICHGGYNFPVTNFAQEDGSLMERSLSMDAGSVPREDSQSKDPFHLAIVRTNVLSVPPVCILFVNSFIQWTYTEHLNTRHSFLGYGYGNEENKNPALTGVAQQVVCLPICWKVVGSIPGQGTCLGRGPGPQLEVCKRQPTGVSLAHRYFPPSLSPSLLLSLKIDK